MRQDWDSYFFEIARVVSTRATCSRASVGAVVVKDRRILATGYNGSLPGLRHCDHFRDFCYNGTLLSDTIIVNGKPSCSLAVHAETNAIADCAKRGISCNGATVYLWAPFPPCANCDKVMKSAGIIEIKESCK